jgi:hypothetical protein
MAKINDAKHRNLNKRAPQPVSYECVDLALKACVRSCQQRWTR